MRVSTTKTYCQKSSGFSLVEVLLATSVFVLIVTAFVGAYLYGEESTMLAGNRVRAVLLAEEGLEAIRNIRDSGFSNLIDGNLGLYISSNQWNQFGTEETIGIFKRSISISKIDENRKLVVSDVKWQQNVGRAGSVTLSTYLSNWQRVVVPVVASSSESSTTPAVAPSP